MNSPLEAAKSDTLDLKVARGREMMLYAQKEWFEAEELNWLLVFSSFKWVFYNSNSTPESKSHIATESTSLNIGSETNNILLITTS